MTTHKPDFDALRKQFPELTGKSDEEIVAYVRYRVAVINAAIDWARDHVASKQAA